MCGALQLTREALAMQERCGMGIPVSSLTVCGVQWMWAGPLVQVVGRCIYARGWRRARCVGGVGCTDHGLGIKYRSAWGLCRPGLRLLLLCIGINAGVYGRMQLEQVLTARSADVMNLVGVGSIVAAKAAGAGSGVPQHKLHRLQYEEAGCTCQWHCKLATPKDICTGPCRPDRCKAWSLG